jgi:N-carbamoyl-L-amino-acid hydrolase
MSRLLAITALVNTSRVLDDLHTLRSFGGTGGGLHGFGVSRRGLTPADVESRRWVANKMEGAGLRSVRLDGIGTVFGEGGDPRAPALLMGSHTDTQPQGGWLDGALGVVYALEAARLLHESGAPGAWAVIDFQDEEGRFSTLTASRAFAGVLPAPPLHLPELAAGRAEAGLSGRPILTHTTAREPTSDRPSERSPQPWLGFFEAHIEQGPRLERANASLGVVTAIVGMRQLILTFSGRQDHAGGCPMDERADAGLAAMRYAAALDASIHEACAGDACDGAVWTFPDLKGFVSHSTVPGNATLTFQFRAPSEPTLDLLDRLARDHCEADAARRLAEGLPPLSSAQGGPGREDGRRARVVRRLGSACGGALAACTPRRRADDAFACDPRRGDGGDGDAHKHALRPECRRRLALVRRAYPRERPRRRRDRLCGRRRRNGPAGVRRASLTVKVRPGERGGWRGRAAGGHECALCRLQGVGPLIVPVCPRTELIAQSVCSVYQDLRVELEPSRSDHAVNGGTPSSVLEEEVGSRL